MRHAGNAGLRAGIAGSAIAFILGIVTLQAHDLWREREVVLSASRLQTQNLARMLEEHARQSLARVDATLVKAQDALAQAGGASRLSGPELRRRLDTLLPTDGLLRALVVIDRDGNFVATTAFPTVPRINVADRDYFIAQRERSDAGMALGTPSKSRVDAQRMLPASARLRTDGGEFDGVLLAVINPGHFQSFYDSIDTGRGGGVALFLRSGWIAARSPHDENLAGRSWSDSPMFREHLARADTGTVRQVVVADGVERIYSYRALRDYPVVVYLGLALDDVLTPWRDELARQALILAVIAAVTLLATAMLLGQARRREASEHALAASEARFRSLTDLSADWYWEQDAELRFTYFSPGYATGARIRGTSVALGLRRWEQGELGLTEAQWAAHRAQLDARLPFRDLELSRLDADGQRLYFIVSGEPVYDAGGRFAGYRGVGRDVTEVRRNQERLRELNATLEARVAERTARLDHAVEELESFCYTLAHDMRAPLRSVTSFANLVLQDAGSALGAESRADLQRIERSARTMALQLDELLSYAGLARKSPGPVTLHMNRLVREVCDDALAQGRDRRVEVTIDDLPDCRADPGLVRLALTHLVSNAFKFTRARDPGIVRIGCEAVDAMGRQVYYVRDNGVGFDMHHAGRLFGVFQRLHVEPEYEGIGAGLAIVKRVIQLHEGNVWVSATVDGGACFYFSLPADDSAARPGERRKFATGLPDAKASHPDSAYQVVEK